MEKDRKEKEIKFPGGFEQNVLGRLLPCSSDTAPLPELIPLDPFVRACRAVVAWGRGPPSPSSSFSPLISLALSLFREVAEPPKP